MPKQSKRSMVVCPTCAAHFAGETEGEDDEHAVAVCPSCGAQVPLPGGGYMRVEGTPAAVAQFVGKLLPGASAERSSRTPGDGPAPKHEKDDSSLGELDVLMITALQDELVAVLRGAATWRRIRLASGTEVFQTTRGAARIGAACALGMGQLAAASLVHELTDAYNVANLFLVGIAAGIGPDVRLGDVVIAEQVIDYEIQKLSPSTRDMRWSVYRPDAALLKLATSPTLGGWYSGIDLARPDASAEPPRAVVGGVLSGNKVIANEAEAGVLRSVWRRAAAIEMEGAGVFAALYLRAPQVAALLVKGVSDHADQHKDDTWRHYAAAAAAAFAWALVDAVPLSRKSLPRAEADVSSPDGPAQRTVPGGRELREAISATFSMSELRVLASDLEIDWDDLPGDSKQLKIVEILSYCTRRDRLKDLVDALDQARDGLFAAFRPFAHAPRPPRPR